MKKYTLLLISVILFSCSKDNSNQDIPGETPVAGNYNRAEVDVLLDNITYTEGQTSKALMYLKFKTPPTELKKSKIIKISAQHRGQSILDKSGLNFSSDSVNGIEVTSANLLEGVNVINYTLSYEDGYQQKSSFNLFVLKSKSLSTWWDNMNYAYLDTVSSRVKLVIPSTDITSVKTQLASLKFPTVSDYSNKIPEYFQIEGLYGVIYPIFNQDKNKIESIVVLNGNIDKDSGISIRLVKADVIKAFPDCIEEPLPSEGIKLSSKNFIFTITRDAKSHVLTTITKR